MSAHIKNQISKIKITRTNQYFKIKQFAICHLLFAVIVCQLSTVNCQLTYAQDAKLKVSADVRSKTLILDPQASSPASPQEGQIYYDDTTNQLYYYDGSAWEVISAGSGGQDKTVATKIVAVKRNPPDAALDSLDATRADYVCDGVDDQVEIQAAIDALGSKPGVVYLLEGTYNISAPIFLNAGIAETPSIVDSGKAIIGAGRGTVLKLTSALDKTGVIKTYIVDRILIANLMIDGNNKLGNFVCGIWINAVNYSKISNVWIENMSGCGIILGDSQGATYNTITNNHFRFNKHRGISNHFWGVCGWANVSNNIIANNIISDNGRDGIEVYTYGGASFKNNVISNNSICSNGTDTFSGEGCGIRIDGYCGSVYSNVISNNNISSNDGTGIALSSYCWNSTVVGNNVHNNTVNGIQVSDGTNYSTVIGNHISLNSQFGIYNAGSGNVISGNVIYENTKDAIYSVTWSLWGHSNIISSNIIYKSGAMSSYYGIIIWAGNDNYVFGNIIYGTGFKNSIYDNGTSTKYTDKTKLTLERSLAQNPGTGGTITQGVSSYVPLNPTSNYSLNSSEPPGAISDGKCAGDLLILENISDLISGYTITIPNGANTKVKEAAGQQLAPGKFFTFVWDGANWVLTGGTGIE